MSKPIEMAVLGALIFKPNEAFELINKHEVSSEWFNDPVNRSMFEHILTMRHLNKNIDILTVGYEFKRDIEHLRHVEECVNAFPSMAYLEGYIDELEMEYKKKILIYGLELLHNKAIESTPDETISGVHSLLDSIHQRQHITEESLYSIGSRLVKQWEDPSRVLGVEPRWSGVSRLIGRYPDGGLIYLAGRPSMGKTTAATNQTAFNASRNVPTAFVTLEMNRDRIVKRMIAEMAGLSTFSLDIGDRPEFMPKVKETVELFKTLPVYIADWSMSTDQLAAWAHSEKRRHGIQMLIVDRIELLRGPKGIRDGDLTAKTSANSTALQQIAKDLNIPVMVLAQLNRMCEVENREPEMFDLRQSGSLEQDATIICIICRDLKNPGTTWFKYVKSQDTRTGRIPMKFLTDINRLVEDMDYYKEFPVNVKDFAGTGKFEPWKKQASKQIELTDAS